MASTRHVRIGDLTLGNDRPLTMIAGPCVLESRAHALEMSQALAEMAGQARHRADLQDLVRQGQPHQFRFRARPGLGGGATDPGRGARDGAGVRRGRGPIGVFRSHPNRKPVSNRA